MATISGSTGNLPSNWSTYITTQVQDVDLISLERRIKALEDTATHVNVAKDQDNRICELESVITDLMEYVNEQKAKAISIAEAQRQDIASMYQRQEAFQKQNYPTMGTSNPALAYPTLAYPTLQVGLSASQSAATQVTNSTHLGD